MGLLACLHTIPLPVAYCVLAVPLPIATRAEMTARCEGSRFGVAVYTNMSSKWQVGVVIFPIGVLITNRTNSDLFRPSVHHPLFLPHAPYEFLMASYILGGWLANIICKFFFTCRKDYCPKCRCQISLPFPYHFLTTSLPIAYQVFTICLPIAHSQN